MLLLTFCYSQKTCQRPPSKFTFHWLRVLKMGAEFHFVPGNGFITQIQAQRRPHGTSGQPCSAPKPVLPTVFLAGTKSLHIRRYLVSLLAYRDF